MYNTTEVGFRILHSFASVSTNRDYLILTNRLNTLISFGNWILGREDKKTPAQTYLSVQLLTFKIINSLLLHKSKGNSQLMQNKMHIQ